ncbi:hypothetical protein Pint_18163 [Pistacia integerrima]|uniref:Uncharacterized protein n=1 Tax=Pistacia integerrima TaxID=434235 RepID=A0ACC0YXC2_9ROSI|nr:hypothetical protein Pint_18163 [Pistacia integerrima]
MFVYATLALCIRGGRSKDAEFVFREMPERDLFSWNSLIACYVQDGKCLQALEVFSNMLQKQKIHNYVTFTSALAACSDPEFAVQGKIVHALMMPQRDTVSWNALIGGYAGNEEPNAAVEAYKLLKEEGRPMNYITITNVLGACLTPQDLLKHGMSIHGHIGLMGIESNKYVQNSLITMYAKCGDLKSSLAATAKLAILEEGQQLNSLAIKLGFDSYPFITNAAMDMYFQKVKENFHEMLKHVKPNHVTFVSLLSAFRHGGLAEEGLEYYTAMTREFGVPAGLEHCVCVFDLLGLSGRLTEAETFINKMPVPPDLVWEACYLHLKFMAIWSLQGKLQNIYPKDAKGIPIDQRDVNHDKGSLNQDTIATGSLRYQSIDL